MTKQTVDLCAITPTGDRPEAFRLCERWMENQTVKPAQWIMVDDGLIPQTITSPLVTQYIRRERQPGEPPHTLVVNVLAALKQVTAGNIAFFEDDEYYYPNYLEGMFGGLQWLGKAEGARVKVGIVGQENSLYYRLPEREYKMMHNYGRASLCVTAVAGFNIHLVKEACEACLRERTPFLDMKIWHAIPKLDRWLTQGRLHIGMKGMPGRRGTTHGWQTEKREGWTRDADCKVLKDLLGDNDFVVYADLMERTGLWQHE
jgi:hypothetical protein